MPASYNLYGISIIDTRSYKVIVYRQPCKGGKDIQLSECATAPYDAIWLLEDLEKKKKKNMLSIKWQADG